MKTISSSKWKVYMIKATSGKLYTGITKDLTRRFKEHQKKQKGARFFHFSSPEKVVWQKTYPNRSEASKKESAIKKLSRTEKLALINSAKKKQAYCE